MSLSDFSFDFTNLDLSTCSAMDNYVLDWLYTFIFNNIPNLEGHSGKFSSNVSQVLSQRFHFWEAMINCWALMTWGL